jgi:diguanylate cyclase (GGDEF)-like protein/PAS domain S-box-containing protein
LKQPFPYTVKDLQHLLLVALLYFIFAKVGLLFALMADTVTLFWIPSGIALAAMLLYGIRIWPGVLAGALLGNAALGWGLAAEIAVGSTLGAVIAAWLLRLFRINEALPSNRDVFLLLFAACFGSLVSALNGAVWLALNGNLPWNEYALALINWWMGDTLGVIMFTPQLLAWGKHKPMVWTLPMRREALLHLLLLVVFCLLVFSDLSRVLFGTIIGPFVLLPLIVWSALRFNMRHTMMSSSLVFLFSILGMVLAQGAFSPVSPETVRELWLYNLVMGMTALFLSVFNYQRNQASVSLSRSEANLKRAQSVAGMGSWTLDIPGNQLEWTDEAYRIFGIAPGSRLSLQSFLGCVHPDDSERVTQAWMAALKGQPYDIEHRILVDDVVKWVRETAEIDFAANGKPLRAFGVVQDTTLSKAHEEQQLLASKVFECSSEAIVITDHQARIVAVNQAFTQITGYPAEEVLGRNPNLLSSGKHDREFYREMWEAITRDGHWQGEIWDQGKSGEIYPKWMSISAVRSKGGEVTHYVSIARDISDNKRTEREIQMLAFYDVLTGLPNRTLLRDRLEQLLVVAHRDGGQFALLFMDLDRFKYVNDSMGHSVGDKLLQSVAERIQGCVREGDTVARLGGDEFVVLLREADSQGASLVAEKLIKVIGEPFKIADVQISTHASIGISLYPDDAQDSDTLVKNADVAMYRAKEDGRNNFQFFVPEMNFRANRIFGMERDLHNAIQQQQFELYYQPQADLTNGMVCGVEVLIRWNHPDKGRVSPADFIPVAEETGQIVAVGEWVLRTACAQLAQWRSRGMPVFPLAVNLSIRQLLQPALIDVVREVLAENGLQPGDLELEITEGIMMGDAKAALDFLTRMHEMGVQLSIDDFGTGYSSLNYLKNLPVDKLKIDQSFVRDIEVDSSDAAIVRSIISLGHRLDLRVIAEGVETLAELDFLRMRGCDEVQGYYFSRPLPTDEFERFIRSAPTLN